MIRKKSPEKLYDFPLTSIQVHGFLKEFLERQRSGLSGHFRVQKYPFDTCLWEGIIAAKFWELDYQGAPLPIPNSNTWWPYEQTAYLLDGLLRLGMLTGDESMIGIFRRNLKYLLAHASDGRLAGSCYHYSSEWPMGVFYKAIRAYLDAFDDPETLEAFHQHYRSVTAEELGDGSRNITNIEGLLDMARRTGDSTLEEKAFRAYEIFNTIPDKQYLRQALTLEVLENNPNPVFHGVTLCEEIKLPVMLYIAGGEKRYLDAACQAWRNVMHYHGQIPGVPCSVEYAFGRDPEFGYESCVISDSLYSLKTFLCAGCGADFADQAEQIAYNALPGAVTKDFSSLQYLSAPNQVLATPFSNCSSFLFGQSPLRQYRPDHFAACCPGNIHRAMPNFISSMWMRNGENAPVAVCFGPSRVKGCYRNQEYVIREETRYPFDGKVIFYCELQGREPLPLTWRVPGWSTGATVKLNGKALEMAENCAGSFVETMLADNDTLEIAFALDVRHCADRQWNWFERGPLVYTLKLGNRCTFETPGDRFSARSMTPAVPWNYAVAQEACGTVVANPEAGGYPFDNPPEFVEVPAHSVKGAFAELAQERYTPKVPLFCTVEEGSETTLRLVPMGATETRLTAFPDARKRHILPILSAFTMECDASKNPERMAPMAFREAAKEIRIDPSGYYDLSRFYHKSQNCDAWLQIRFYSDVDGNADCCVMLSDGGCGYMDGEKIFEIPTIMEAEFMHPLWFPVKVKKGHNYLVLHVVDEIPTYDHRDAWGAKVLFFR